LLGNQSSLGFRLDERKFLYEPGHR
jgi:hypothetical protein